MPRPIWKGAISFGLVTVPVGLYSATERSREISFHLLHAKDQSRIDYKRFCEEEGVEVPWSEIVKGYEYEKGKHVVITDEDFEKAQVPGTQTFEIRDFVPAGDIDFTFFEQPYYLAPGGKGAAKAYALLRDALARSGRVGVGTIVLRQREHLAALQPAGEVLALTTMRFADEIRSPRTLDLPADGRYGKREMDLALQLVDTLAAEWKPEQYRDQYREVLLDIIKRKAEGETIRAPKRRKPATITNLAKALRASLKSPRAARAAPPARRAARGASARRHRERKAA
jgi:DNA end-binding protein Ku